SSSTETIMSYFLGIMTLYFFLEKKRAYFFASLFLVLLGTKRAVYLSIALCIVTYYLFKPLEKKIINNRNLVALVFTILNLAAAYLFFLIVDGYFDHLIIEHTGLSPNSFFKGRIALYKLVLDYTEGLPY